MDNHSITTVFGGRLRIRVSGIYLQPEGILLAQHAYPDERRYFLSPPGGGMDYAETMIECLKREFFEETSLVIEPQQWLCVHEFQDLPLHAVEHFFIVKKVNGFLSKGKDPELEEHRQIIDTVRFYAVDELQAISNINKHPLLHHIQSLDDILIRKGYYLNGTKHKQ